MRHGNGKYTYNVKAEEGTNDGVYTGCWKQNLRSGIGKQTYPGVGMYYGYWENSEGHGKCVMSHEKSKTPDYVL